MKYEAFITGSRAYGTPRPDSDIDLGILVSKHDADILRQYSGSKTKVVFGQLNLVLFEKDREEERYENWKQVNEQLRVIAPVTKDQAIRALDHVKANATFSGMENS